MNDLDQVITFVFEGTREERLDKVLVQHLSDFSRARLQNLIKEGKVCLNGRVITKTGFPVQPGQQIQVTLPPPQPSRLQPEDIPLDILFENDDLIILNKPAGMVVHPSPGHLQGTLVHGILAYHPDLEGIGGERRPGIVHRLDKETSGLLLVAKNDRAHRWLQDQFRHRQVRKTYLALVDGHPPTPRGRIEAPVGRDPLHRQKMSVLPPGKGREAITEYHTLEAFRQHTLLEVHPLTGRTHQIRVHMAFLGCPIVGDTLYGHRHPSLPVSRHFLHAARLTLRLPGENEPRTFEAPLPADLERILAWLRQYQPA
ncbi:RluA family pseudouridine synthase [Thermanaerothrix sp.]|jgi:23S rRNA pseudouridine1911/1915/1917 synthase|uniref:RluA family pseudouridine synthase n=1 Tax=Thermanaerothrix sp. TaxID=2972675 RepID=UPI002ADDB16C|nr:RluA family pseudouridine synthase [Thermanaerothrix sp.]